MRLEDLLRTAAVFGGVVEEAYGNFGGHRRLV